MSVSYTTMTTFVYLWLSTEVSNHVKGKHSTEANNRIYSCSAVKNRE